MLEELLDYAKKSVGVISENKVIFIPYGVLLLLKILLLLGGVSLGLSIAGDLSNGTLVKEDFLAYTHFLPQIILGGITIAFLLIVVLSFFQAGISSMFMLAVRGEKVNLSDFWAGGRYFFSRILGGYLLLGLASIILSPFILTAFIIIGVFTLGLGFFFLPLLAGVFLGMWKVSLVLNDSDILSAFKNSFRFGRDYFWPFLVVNFIVAIINGSTSLGGGHNNTSKNLNLNTDNLQGLPSYFAISGVKWLIGFGGMIFGAFFLVVSVIKAIFDVFFGCYYFVFYMAKRGYAE